MVAQDYNVGENITDLSDLVKKQKELKLTVSYRSANQQPTKTVARKITIQ
jgi:hypothetical protein